MKHDNIFKVFLASFLLLYSVCSHSQPGSSYSNVAAFKNFSITGQTSVCTSGDCDAGCYAEFANYRYSQFGFYYPSGGYVWPSEYETNTSATITLNQGPGTVTIQYRTRSVQIANEFEVYCNPYISNDLPLHSFQVTFVPDLAKVGSLPSQLCVNASGVELYNHVNKSSGVTFYVDGTAIPGSTFYPSLFGTGSHSISASYVFTNGTTNVSLGTVNVLPAIAVTLHPSAVTQCPSGAASFIAAGTGHGLYYQWQESSNGGGSFSDLSNAGVYGGVNTGTLTIANVAGLGGRVYRLKMIGTCSTEHSNNAGLSIFGPVPVSSSPSNQTICQGGNASFSAAGTPFSGGMSYQWQWSGDGGASWSNINNGLWAPYATTVSGATTGTIVLSNVPVALNAGRVRLVMHDGCGPGNQNISASAVLTVYGAVTVSSNPSNVSRCPGGSASFSASGVAKNGTLSYQWQESANGASWDDLADGPSARGTISGANASTLNLSSITTSANGYMYRCRLTDGCGLASGAFSSPATLSFFGNVVITGNPSNRVTCPGGTVTYSASATGPNGALTYQWQVSTNSGVSYSNLSNGGGYSGVTTASLTLNNVSATWSTDFSSLRYRCVIRDDCGAATESVTAAAALALYGSVSISVHPISTSICPGGNTIFSVSATAQNGSLTYQWQLSSNNGTTWGDLTNSSIYSGVTTPTLSLMGASSAFSGFKYRVKVGDGCGGVSQAISNEAILTIYGGPVISAHPTNRTICPNASVSFAVTASAANGGLAYQWEESSDGGSTFINVSNGGAFSGATTATLTISGVSSSKSNYRYRVVVSDGCGTVSQTISNAGVLTFNTPVSLGSQPANRTGCVGGDVTFSVAATGSGLAYQWQESVNGGSTFANITNTGIYSGATSPTLSLTGVTAAFSTRRYRALVTGTCNTLNSDAGTLTVIVPPAITLDPSASTVCQGTAASFSVTASGSSLSYQWQHSSSGGAGTFTNIGGATSSSYSIASTSATQAGYYRAVVNNGCAGGGTASGAAQLIVNPLTTFTTQPTNASVCPGGSTTFSITAAGTGSIAYQWEVSTNGGSTFTNLSNGGVYSGVTTRTLSIFGVTPSISGYAYRVRATGGCGSTIVSSNGVLTVNPIPARPTVADPSRCGDGLLAATASSTAQSPVFGWYANENDASPVFSGATYQINNLVMTTRYYVTVTSLNCESPKEEVIFTRHARQDVPLGSPLSLCMGQGPYNLEEDISDGIAKGSNFTWMAHGTNYTSKNFDPGVGAGSYVVSYDPPASAKSVPYCYTITTRNVTVVSDAGEGGITFNSELVSNGSTVNMCVGDDPVDISTFPSIPGGTWSTISGTGLSFSGNGVVFTPNQNSYTAISPNVFRYTVMVNGCSASKDLDIYVKDNQHTPIVTGISGVACPGKELDLSASVSTPGSFTYEWYRSGETTPFATSNNISFTVDTPETLQVRSINSPFGCRSEATLAVINTPFSSGTIDVSRSTVQAGNFVTFSTDAPGTGNAFKWDFGDGATSMEKNPTHYYYQVGDFIVKLSIQSNLGCSQVVTYDKIIVTGEPIGNVTGEENPLQQEVRVHPNPINSDITIDSDMPILSYTLVDQYGRYIQISRLVQGGKKSITINASELKAGVYVLHVQAKDRYRIIKLIKR